MTDKKKKNDYLDIDPSALSNEKLAELSELLNGAEQHKDLLRKVRGELIDRLRNRQHVTTEEIVKRITENRRRPDRDLLAKEWSGPLGISDREFRRIANQR